MSLHAASVLRLAATLLVGSCSIWGAFALRYQAPGRPAFKSLAALTWIGIHAVLIIALWRGHAAPALLAFAAGFAALLCWWRRIMPSNDRIWADDVARMTCGTVHGNRVSLHNVRNFDWRSASDYTQRWETRDYDLDRLNSVDMIMSYWSRRAIAHVLISFGFDDGAQVAFSVEIRREKTESYSEIGGFFKQFELSIVAADERDVVRVRTNVRGEDDYLYRLRLPAAAMRSLFLGYVGEANALIAAPRFYNTLTVNCTTLVYRMMTRIVGRLPLDYRLLFSGYLPQYVYRVGGLDSRYPLEELRARGRISERAKQADRSASFCADIRRGIHPLSAAAPERSSNARF